MNLLGNDTKPGVSPLRIEIRIHRAPIDGGSAVERTAIDGNPHVVARLFGCLQHGRYPRAQRRGEVGRVVHSIGVSEYRNLIVRGEGALDRSQAIVHLLHGVPGQALVDHQGNGEPHGVGAEDSDTLANVVLVNFEIPPSQSCNLLMFLVQHGDRHSHVVDRVLKVVMSLLRGPALGNDRVAAVAPGRPAGCLRRAAPGWYLFPCPVGFLAIPYPASCPR